MRQVTLASIIKCDPTSKMLHSTSVAIPLCLNVGVLDGAQHQIGAPVDALAT